MIQSNRNAVIRKQMVRCLLRQSRYLRQAPATRNLHLKQ